MHYPLSPIRPICVWAYRLDEVAFFSGFCLLFVGDLAKHLIVVQTPSRAFLHRGLAVTAWRGVVCQTWWIGIALAAAAGLSSASISQTARCTTTSHFKLGLRTLPFGNDTAIRLKRLSLRKTRIPPCPCKGPPSHGFIQLAAASGPILTLHPDPPWARLSVFDFAAAGR